MTLKTKAMEVFTEVHSDKKTLFKRAHAILKQNGLYDITQHHGGFILYYFFFTEDCRIAYTVLKGRNGKAFKLTIGGQARPKQEINLVTGDVLYLHYQRKKKAWFYCPKALIGKREFKMEFSIGVTEYGTITNMLYEGLIAKVDYPEGKLR